MKLIRALAASKGMVGPLSMLDRIAGPPARMAIGGAPSRMALGAAVGGLAGFFGTDMEDPTNRLGAAFRGSVMGAGIGGLSRLVTPALTSGGFKRPMISGNAALTAGKYMGATGALGVQFAAQHPFLVGGGIAGAMALNNMSSPYNGAGTALDFSSTINLGREAQALERLDQGVMPMRSMTTASMARLHGSTSGLVQSLHNRRH